MGKVTWQWCHRSTVPRVHIHRWGQFCVSQCGKLGLPHDSGCISANKPTTAPWVSHRKRSETHKQRASLKTFLKKVNVINYKTEELFQRETRWLSKATDRLHADLKKRHWKRTVKKKKKNCNRMISEMWILSIRQTAVVPCDIFWICWLHSRCVRWPLCS